MKHCSELGQCLRNDEFLFILMDVGEMSFNWMKLNEIQICTGDSIPIRIHRKKQFHRRVCEKLHEILFHTNFFFKKISIFINFQSLKIKVETQFASKDVPVSNKEKIIYNYSNSYIFCHFSSCPMRWDKRSYGAIHSNRCSQIGHSHAMIIQRLLNDYFENMWFCYDHQTCCNLNSSWKMKKTFILFLFSIVIWIESFYPNWTGCSDEWIIKRYFIHDLKFSSVELCSCQLALSSVIFIRYYYQKFSSQSYAHRNIIIELLQKIELQFKKYLLW